MTKDELKKYFGSIVNLEIEDFKLLDRKKIVEIMIEKIEEWHNQELERVIPKNLCITCKYFIILSCSLDYETTKDMIPKWSGCKYCQKQIGCENYWERKE